MIPTQTGARKEPHPACPGHRGTCTILLSCLLGGVACAGPVVIPMELQGKVDRTISFKELQNDPERYKGRSVVLGGPVISARRLRESTRIEVLQLPLDESLEPGMILTRSEGRFLAFHLEVLDPAVLPVGTRITIVGEVTGSFTGPLDEATYTYPTLIVQSMTIWPYMVTGYGFGPHPYFGAYRGPFMGPPPGFEKKVR